MRRAVWWAFGGYLLLSGLPSLTIHFFHLTWPDLLRLGFHDLIVFLTLTAVVLGKKVPRPRQGELMRLAVWFAVLFAAWGVVDAAVGGNIGGSAITLVFAAVPFLTVFLVAQRDGGDLGSLAPAVVALGGMALLVPFHLPVGGVGMGSLGMVMLCAGLVAYAGIQLHALMQGMPVLWVASMATAAAMVLSLLGWFAFDGRTVPWGWGAIGVEGAWALLVDLPLVLLAVWLVREMQPVAFSARFFLTTLVSIAGGMVMMRPVVPWTSWLGLVLGLGAGWVLVRDGQGEAVRLDRVPTE